MSLIRQTYEILCDVPRWPEAQRRRFIDEALPLLKDAQAKDLLAEALGEGWEFEPAPATGGPVGEGAK